MRDWLQCENAEGMTALHLACIKGAKEVALLLCRACPDLPHVVSTSGRSPVAQFAVSTSDCVSCTMRAPAATHRWLVSCCPWGVIRICAIDRGSPRCTPLLDPTVSPV